MELVTVQIGKFVKNIDKKKTKNVLLKKVVHQTFWFIECR